MSILDITDDTHIIDAGENTQDLRNSTNVNISAGSAIDLGDPEGKP